MQKNRLRELSVDVGDDDSEIANIYALFSGLNNGNLSSYSCRG
jgi:hypothetical protein